MDRKTIVGVSKALQGLDVKAIEKKFGVKIDIDGGSYSESNGTLKIKVSDVKKNGNGEVVVSTEFRTDFEAYARMWGLKKSDFGKIFKLRGVAYKIAGGKRRSPKYPIVANRVSDGAGFKFSAEDVVRALKV